MSIILNFDCLTVDLGVFGSWQVVWALAMQAAVWILIAAVAYWIWRLTSGSRLPQRSPARTPASCEAS